MVPSVEDNSNRRLDTREQRAKKMMGITQGTMVLREGFELLIKIAEKIIKKKERNRVEDYFSKPSYSLGFILKIF